MYFPKLEQEYPKKFLVFKVIVFEVGSTNSHIIKQDTTHWRSICYQATLTFKIYFREKFSKLGSLRVMKTMMKLLSCTFYKKLGCFNNVDSQRVFRNGCFSRVV